MNDLVIYVLAGAAVGYYRSKTKKGRNVAALKGAALTWVAVTKVAPRLGVNLPPLRSLAA